MRRASLLVPALLLAVAAAACADVASGLPAGDAVAAPIAEALEEFDGEHFGFLTSVTTDPAVVVIDPATWVADDDEPNGYRIDDPGVAPIELPVADDAVIEIFRSTGDPGTAAEVTVEELADWLAGLGMPEIEAAFNVTVADGEVASLRFVYRP